jgi:hypothetical protein
MQKEQLVGDEDGCWRVGLSENQISGFVAMEDREILQEPQLKFPTEIQPTIAHL